jgi:hypothetical protein
LPGLPTTEVGLYQWVAVLVALYVMSAMAINYVKHGRVETSSRSLIVHIFDGATFALSCALLAGVFVPPILSLLGNITIFLIIASLAGIAYSVRQLFVG